VIEREKKRECLGQSIGEKDVLGENEVSNNDKVSKEKWLDFIRFLEAPLGFYDEPVYTPEEKKAIKDYRDLAFSFYSDLKTDGYVAFNQTFSLSDEAKAERDKDLRFFKIAMDISNKLLNIKEFGAEEQWLILLSMYCWYSEMIKNLLLEEAKKIHKSLSGKAWKSFMTLGQFMCEMQRYKNGKHKALFSEIDVDLRNSFDHANIDFNDEIRYNDKGHNEKILKLDQMLSMFKKIPALYTILLRYRQKVFLEDVKSAAKKMGYL
jgi:hypothetical protein